jgi:BirA family biotin operon repressor/biotin-[acetyl-CoA-carboxylase] ligase
MPEKLPVKLKKLIQILSDGEFHSGENLGKQLGITRAAVWKLLKQLVDWDIELEAVTNKGYRLSQGIELLDANRFKAELSPANKKQLNNLEIFDVISSTNDHLMQTFTAKTEKVQICFAEKQLAGKARRGKAWVSPYGRNIYLSIGWRFERDASQLACLSLSIGVAVINALTHYGIKQSIDLKWPNDIYWQKQKLAGILIEIMGETHSHCHIIVGVGLNLNLPKTAAGQIDQPWIDIASITQTKPERNKLAGLLLNELLLALTTFEQKGFSPFKAQWQQYDCTLGKMVKIIMPTNIITGIGRGIDEKGCFLLENERGELQRFSSGEVSLRL